MVVTHATSHYADADLQKFEDDANTNATNKAFMKEINRRIVMVELDFKHASEEEMRKNVFSMVERLLMDNRDNMLYPMAKVLAPLDECFSTESIIYTLRGPKLMCELLLNDKVLVANQQGNLQFENVVMFSHATQDEVGSFLSISTDDGKVLSLSPGHLVHVGEVGQLKPAKDVKVGDVMFACNVAEQDVGSLKQVKVTEISKEWFTPGIYCPHTPGGSIIVDGVLASCYTDLMSPTLAHTLMYPVRMLHRVLPEDWFVWLMPYNSEQGMPKVLWKLRNMIPFLTK